MAATLIHRTGEVAQYPDHDDELVLELDAPADPEHPEVAVTTESGWTLSAFPSGQVGFEKVEGDARARHRTGITRDETRRRRHSTRFVRPGT